MQSPAVTSNVAQSDRTASRHALQTSDDARRERSQHPLMSCACESGCMRASSTVLCTSSTGSSMLTVPAAGGGADAGGAACAGKSVAMEAGANTGMTTVQRGACLRRFCRSLCRSFLRTDVGGGDPTWKTQLCERKSEAATRAGCAIGVVMM